MKAGLAHASELLELPHLTGKDAIRATFRQSMAMLSRSAVDDELSPLEGLSPHALAKAVKVALEHGLVDELDWLTPQAAGATLYELASALPNGAEQREVGRRVFSRLQAANAETFVAIATRMALGAGKGLHTPAVRARVGLVLELPIGAGIADERLALCLCSGRDLVRDWVSLPSTGGLPARRRTARLLERAAREASKRASQGDDHAIRIFRSGAVHDALNRLLADREGLVWRHAAIARGLVAPWISTWASALETTFGAGLTPTEWRRGATSLAAMLAVDRETAGRVITSALDTGILSRDAGVGAALVWGSTRSVEVEPEFVGQMLLRVGEVVPLEAGDAMTEFLEEYGRPAAVEKSIEALVRDLREFPKWEDDGAEAHQRLLQAELSESLESSALRNVVKSSLAEFVKTGAKEAYGAAKEAIETLQGHAATLEEIGADDDGETRRASLARRATFTVLRDVDRRLLERSVLSDLLSLGSEPAVEKALEDSRGRIANWLIEREAKTVDDGDSALTHPSLRLTRLRALLHLVDSEAQDPKDVSEESLRRVNRVVERLLVGVRNDPPKVLRRAMFATLARGLDALLRAEFLDWVDVFLLITSTFDEKLGLRTMAEASMDLDTVRTVERYAVFASFLETAEPGQFMLSEPVAPSNHAVDETDSIPPMMLANLLASPGLLAFERLVAELFEHPTGRAEALRAALSKCVVSLKKIERARSLRAISGEYDDLSVLETGLSVIAQLTRSARSKFESEGDEPAIPLVRKDDEKVSLSLLVARSVSGNAKVDEPSLKKALYRQLVDLPLAVQKIVEKTVLRVANLPVEATEAKPDSIRGAAEQLPPWIPSRRTLGGFYIVRGLGGGAAGSVFTAKRAEERRDADAEVFALKVPEYSTTAARSMSETEFLSLFRSEASALLAVPQHRNLARFVTFDAGAKPKPILVMEYVEGVTLEHLVASRALSMKSAFAALDDVLAGLDTMHKVGVGHLDVKPSNVILRDGKEAVLVDFGLAGRNIRPGCATGPYGAPEVWGALDDNAKATPQAADVYAFGCLAYEVLTSNVLFNTENELQLISMHIAHDGTPEPLAALKKKSKRFVPLVDLMSQALRRNPASRASVPAMRESLARIGKELANESWPLGAE